MIIGRLFNKNEFTTNSIRNAHYLRSELFVPNRGQNLKNPKQDGSNQKKKSEKKSSNIIENNGFVYDNGNGFLTFLPLGQRVLNNLKKLIRDEMNTIKAQEINMPALCDIGLWKATGRDENMGSELLRLKDRQNRDLCLSPTHEEVVTKLFSKLSKSIPTSCFGEQKSLRLYQITRKFRDESRPKHTLLRSREFYMKDMYTFHTSESCAYSTYEETCKAYENIFDKLDIKYIKCAASVGAMGGSKSNEFHMESNIGEDKIYSCEKCGLSISSELIHASKESGKVTQANICDKLNCMQGTVERNSEVKEMKSIEIGHTFLLGERYTKVFPISSQKATEPVLMGCYGIGVSRLMQACVEARNVDDMYPDWPFEIAPFQIGIIPAKKGSPLEDKSEKMTPYLYDMLDTSSIFNNKVIVDDRTSITIGSRIIDAKMMGVPFLIILGKCIEEEKIEILINSPSIQKYLGVTKLECHSRETVHVLKQLKNDYLYKRKAKKLNSYFE